MRSIIVTIFVLWLTNISASAQQKQTKKFNITKGYYSIYNNHEKLNNKGEIVRKNLTSPFVTKGYYTIHKSTQNKTPGYLHQSSGKPKATKGYYSIYPDSLQAKQ